MERTFFALGAISACIAVGTGAFGAHGLKARVPPEMVAVFDTGARYQMYHALALIAAGLAAARWPSAAVTWAGWLFVAGTVVFSGSLYALVLTGVKALGAVTPGAAAISLGSASSPPIPGISRSSKMTSIRKVASWSSASSAVEAMAASSRSASARMIRAKTARAIAESSTTITRTGASLHPAPGCGLFKAGVPTTAPGQAAPTS